jgi:RNA polymerase sigma factor (sigma-70 family)
MAQAPETRASLLMRVRDAGDDAAWAQFVEIYAPLIYGHGRKRGLQDADAADVTQEVLRAVARAMRRLAYDPRKGSFRGWLFTVVRNKVRTFLKKEARRPADGASALADVEAAPVDEDAAWDAEYEQRLFAWAATQVRTQVADATWEAFSQTAVDGRSPKDVAQRLGMAVAAVYMAKSRVLARLREVIRQVQGDEHHD